MYNKTLIIAAIIVVVVLLSLSLFIYTISETEQVVITQFGEYKRIVRDAGLHLKKPILENRLAEEVMEQVPGVKKVVEMDKKVKKVKEIIK